jgi:hypothetical protein
MSAAELFGKYLDLTPLHRRSRGLVRCRFHHDPKASLSVDVEKGLFNCFGCGVRGGLRRFAELVGEALGYQPPAAREAPLSEAFRRAVEQRRRRDERAALWLPLYTAADFIRRSFAAVGSVRVCATALGPDHPKTWAALELAAQVERDAMAVEAELEACLIGRITGEQSLEALLARSIR